MIHPVRTSNIVSDFDVLINVVLWLGMDDRGHSNDLEGHPPQ